MTSAVPHFQEVVLPLKSHEETQAKQMQGDRPVYTTAATWPQVQEDEVTALTAIYGDDFTNITPEEFEVMSNMQIGE